MLVVTSWLIVVGGVPFPPESSSVQVRPPRDGVDIVGLVPSHDRPVVGRPLGRTDGWVVEEKDLGDPTQRAAHSYMQDCTGVCWNPVWSTGRCLLSSHRSVFRRVRRQNVFPEQFSSDPFFHTDQWRDLNTFEEFPVLDNFHPVIVRLGILFSSLFEQTRSWVGNHYYSVSVNKVRVFTMIQFVLGNPKIHRRL